VLGEARVLKLRARTVHSSSQLPVLLTVVILFSFAVLSEKIGLECVLGAFSAGIGDPARFHSAAALASYVGVAPRLRQSGKRRFSGTAVIRLGNVAAEGALDASSDGRTIQFVVARLL
jgi:transposase IS116/IS110/IS902 family protein